MSRARAAQKRRLQKLYREAHLERLQEEEYLDEMWFHYRIFKQYYAAGDYFDMVAAHKRESRTYAVNIVWGDPNIPPSGSPYWLTTTKRPKWWAEKELF